MAGLQSPAMPTVSGYCVLRLMLLNRNRLIISKNRPDEEELAEMLTYHSTVPIVYVRIPSRKLFFRSWDFHLSVVLD